MACWVFGKTNLHKDKLPSEAEAVIVPGGFSLEIICVVERLPDFLPS